MNDIPAELTAALATRFELRRVLGRGGMATVYLAHDSRHGREVAPHVGRRLPATSTSPAHCPHPASASPYRVLQDASVGRRACKRRTIPTLERDAASGLRSGALYVVESELFV